MSIVKMKNYAIISVRSSYNDVAYGKSYKDVSKIVHRRITCC